MAKHCGIVSTVLKVSGAAGAWWVGALASAGWLGQAAWAATAATAPDGGGVPSPIGNNSMMAASPMTEYTVGAVIYVLVIGFLVAGMLIGGLLILNIGLMSKRESDRIGGRTPSDVGVLQSTNWPEQAENISVLPAEDSEERSGEPQVGEGEEDERRAA